MIAVEIYQASRFIDDDRKRVRIATATKIADLSAVPRVGDWLDHAAVKGVGFSSIGERISIVLKAHEADYDSDVDSQIKQWQELGYTVKE